MRATGGAFAVRLSVGVFPYDRWGGLAPLADAMVCADRLGFFGAALPDHVVTPLREGREPVATVWYDPFVLAAYLAARTERLRLVFYVLVLPYRPPLQTAKQIATLDQVSGGRVVVGVGEGWMRGEFRALGLDRRRRAHQTDEYLDAMVSLWTDDEPSFDGDEVRFRNLAFEPRCVQSPHPPVWIGGSGPRALARAERIGDGWAPMIGGPDELAPVVARLRDAHGRRRTKRPFSVSAYLEVGRPDGIVRKALGHAGGARDDAPPRGTQEILDAIEAHRSAGVDHLVLGFPWRDPAEYRDALERFAADILPCVGNGD